MDRPRRRPRLLIGVAGLLLVAAAPPSPPPLRAMRWLPPGADAGRILTRQPPECLRLPADAERAYSIELGRAAFRSPLLLGGQAARAGVACETCHRNGRSNPDFDFPGVSGAPGTADVTDSLFSSHRGDGIDNPKRIPDLGGPKAALKVSQDTPGALEAFIHGLVTEEFDGAEPPPAVLKGLADYVRSMDPKVCAGRGEGPVSLQTTLEEARRAVRAASAALARHDAGAALVMLQAGRGQLGLAAERYAAPTQGPERLALQSAAESLTAAVERLAQGDLSGTQQRLTAWLADSRPLEMIMARNEARSLFDARRLAARR